jgi:C1A family cysteine protease
MKINIRIVILTFLIGFYTAELTKNNPIHAQILSSFEGNTKTMFKVYHFIFNKSYDINSYESIQKYKVFKANLQKIKEINNSGKPWVAGINHLTDMTYEELKKYYNLKPMTVKQFRNKVRNLFNFDDYNDDEEEKSTNTPTNKVSVLSSVDWRKYDLKIRDQGNCGSCWAFTTASMLEGQWGIQKGASLENYISTQQMVDCDKSNSGCDGGWYNGALQYLIDNGSMFERDYPYEGIQKTTCLYKQASVFAKVKDYKEFYEGPNFEEFESMILRGPVAVAIDVPEDFQSYQSGIWNGKCTEQVQHAVTLVGYHNGGRASPSYWIIRNSWGVNWGELGYMKLLHNEANNKSCNLQKYGYQGNWI